MITKFVCNKYLLAGNINFISFTWFNGHMARWRKEENFCVYSLFFEEHYKLNYVVIIVHVRLWQWSDLWSVCDAWVNWTIELFLYKYGKLFSILDIFVTIVWKKSEYFSSQETFGSSFIRDWWAVLRCPFWTRTVCQSYPPQTFKNRFPHVQFFGYDIIMTQRSFELDHNNLFGRPRLETIIFLWLKLLSGVDKSTTSYILCICEAK
jgi:hypothetical protein